jgi:L-amino acid N-acyltransferase YncA
MAEAWRIRRAEAGDAAAITAIYAHHVLHGTGTFDVEPPPQSRWEALVAAHRQGGHPFLVAEAAGRIAGFAYAGPFRDRLGWRFSYEDTIYVAPELVGQGLGTQLLEALITESRQAGARHLVAVIGDSANFPSLRVHKRCGFAQIGILRGVGFKFGRWLDVVLMQLDLKEPRQ